VRDKRRCRLKNVIRLAMVTLFATVLLAIPSLAQIPADMLIIGMSHEPIIDFAPARVYEFEGGFVLEQVYDQLVNFVGGTAAFEKIEPGLAESWEVSTDGLTWTFHIRKNAVFHSGNPVDADAIVFSLRRALERHEPPIWITEQFVPEQEMIQKVGDYSVSIKTEVPLGEMLVAACFGYQGIASILDPAVVEEHATTDDPLAVTWLAEHDAGSGPFILKQWIKRDQIVLEAFSDYWAGAPSLKTIIIKDLPEPTAQKLALEKGDIDIAWNLLPEMVNDLRGKAGIGILETPTFYYHYAAMNCSYEPFSNVKVRQAVRWAIDYEAITEGIMSGAALKCPVIMPVGMFSHLDLSYYQDIEKAKQLMKEAGYEDGFEVKLLTRTDPPYPDISAQVKEDLKKINIDVKVIAMVYAQLLNIYRAQQHQMVLIRWGVDYADPSAQAAPFAHCRTTGPDAKVRQIAWRNAYVSGVTDWVEQAAGERDARKREVMYKAIQAIVLEEGPYVLFHNPIKQAAIRDIVTGLQIPPMWYYTELRSVSKQ